MTMEVNSSEIFRAKAAIDTCLSSGLMQDFRIAFDKVNTGLHQYGHDSHLFQGWTVCLMILLTEWFKHPRELEDTDEFIDLVEQARQSVGDQLSDRNIELLESFQAKAEEDYRKGITLDRLKESIRVTREAVESMPKDHPSFVQQSHKLQRKLKCKYDITGDFDDLNKAIEIERIVVQSMDGEANSQKRLMRLQNLRFLISERFNRTKKLEDLDESIDIWREVCKHMRHTNSKLPVVLSWLAIFLCDRYRRTGNVEDLEEATITAKQAVDRTSDNDPHRALALIAFVKTLVSADEQQKDNLKLEEAILFVRQCVEFPLGAESHQLFTYELVGLLKKRFDRAGDIEDLEEAIQIVQRDFQANPGPYQDNTELLSTLGAIFFLRYNEKGRIEDLEQAIELTQNSVELTAIEDENYIHTLNQLSCMFSNKYELTGELAYINKAISFGERAIALGEQALALGLARAPGHSQLLGDLAIKLRLRYERTNEIVDLDEAIRITRQAIDLGLTEQLRNPSLVHILSSLLHFKYIRTGNITHIDEAIRILKRAIDTIREDSPVQAHYLESLGSHLGIKFIKTRKVEDICKAIDALRKSIALMPDTHPGLFTVLNNLGRKLGHRYGVSGDITDLNEAIALLEKSIMLLPNDHPRAVNIFHDLGCMFMGQFERTIEIEDCETALNFFLCGWNSETAQPLDRIRSGVQALQLYVLFALPMDNRGIDLAIAIINLLPKVHTRALRLTDQEHILSEFKGVVPLLFALLLSVGRLNDALQYFDQGRTVIISQLIDDRSDLSILKQSHTVVAHQYQSLIDEINSPLDTTTSGVIRRGLNEKRRRDVDKLDECLKEIRTLPGHERFLMGKTVSELQRCAGEGTIVIVNVAPLRSDAVLISSSSVTLLKMPQHFAKEAAEWLLKKWTVKKKSEYVAKNDDFSAYLSWLWDNCVKHIIYKIKSTQVSKKPGLPKVWWIGSGLGSSMPFHAAGYHNHGSLENAYSTVISSYTPSIKALEYSLSQSRSAKEVQPEYNHMLIALMPTSPKGSKEKKAPKPLSGVLREKDEIMAVAQGNTNTIVLDHPSSEEVLRSLQKSYIAHFACHGISDQKSPSNSGLILQRRDEPEQHIQEDRLTVQRIAHLSLRGAQIAYLSACSTAKNKISDGEVIHIVSGFQVAGFPHVIGCLWPAADTVCVEVAAEFYSLVLKSPKDAMDEDVAWSLQKAVMKVREESPTTPLEWAQFVHYGA